MKATENNGSVETKTNDEELKIKINVVGEAKYSDVEPGAIIIVGYPDDNGYFEPWQFRTVTKVFGNGHIFESFKDGYFHEDNDEVVKYEALRYSAGKAPYEFDVLKLS